MNTITGKIRAELIRNADEKIRISGERFFKEDIKLHGLKSAQVTRIGNEYYKEIPERNKEMVFKLCEELWETGFFEEAIIACIWSHRINKEYAPEDFVIFEKWVNTYVTNWATCDTLCNHSVGSFIEMYPSYLAQLKKWTGSGNRWVKRASAVSLIVPAKKGMFLGDILEIAGLLHSDPDDMVQKGYGWMLKVASQAHLVEIFNYVMSKKETMPRTSLRYAIEKMPPDLKAKAMSR